MNVSIKNISIILITLSLIAGCGNKAENGTISTENEDIQTETQTAEEKARLAEEAERMRAASVEHEAVAGANKWQPNVEYTYFADGSCKNEAGVECIDLNTYENACNANAGVSKLALDTIKVITIGDEKDLAMAGNFSELQVKWTGKNCYVALDATGMVNGTSKKASYWGSALVFNLDKQGNSLLIKYVDWFH
jgi:hypothetical protein